MNKVVHVCTGTCKAEISEEQYNDGLTQCGAERCTMQGHNFEKRMRCGSCNQLYKEGETHTHEKDKSLLGKIFRFFLK
ncbi:MAG: hypothetical protein A3C22_01135 [Candidatus Levybacteria bacterium RIFCSPHIGHO2_02_FULL_37_10]|nr:MAG: hypothetical protein A3C22_01135 [Candidatus Levybacteria bacterium RIFCSPHIGHO2_02_FULL_37_10]OGH42989.1 MAG: hypothetical protein A3B53_03035 [Candidatus Levybacteria bacterium RIFCSPLOWO2_01_FULL_42_15]